jgi:uncharacterized protein (TIGR02147 family)
MNVFESQDYKQCVNKWIEGQPKGGHGQLRRIAAALSINSVVMTQVFRGHRDLTPEQAVGVAKFMGLNEMERDYFLLLVQEARAGSHELKKIIKTQIASLRTAAQALKNRIKHQKFTDEDKATFYSQWYYSAVRLGVSIEGLGSVSAIADHLHLERSLVAKVVEFLICHKLIEEKAGRLEMGPQVTHVGHDSPFVNRHHTNWRLKALQSLENVSDKELFYTGPMALSRQAADEIRHELVSLVERSTKKAAASDSEILACLCIDWFQV